MKINSINLNFASRKNINQKSNMPGFYEELDQYKNKGTDRIDVMHTKYVQSNGDLSSIKPQRDELITIRLKKALKDAQKFTQEHPQYNVEDVMQDLAIVVILGTNKQIENGKDSKNYYSFYSHHRDRYFSDIIASQTDDIPLEDCKNVAIPTRFDGIDKPFKEEELKLAMEKIEELPKHQKDTIKKFYGIGDTKKETLEQISTSTSSTNPRSTAFKTKESGIDHLKMKLNYYKNLG